MKLAQTEDVFRPKVKETFTFARVVVEPGVRTAAVAWEAPAKRSQAFYLPRSDDRPKVGGVATAGFAAADCGNLVLQQQISDAAGAAVGVAAAAQGGSGPPIGTEASEGAGRVAKLCG